MLDLTRMSFDSSLIFLAVMALFSAILAERAIVTPHRQARPQSIELRELLGTTGAAFLASVLLTNQIGNQLPVAILCFGLAATVRVFSNRLSMPGILWLTVEGLAVPFSMLWAYLFVIEAGLPVWVEGLALAGLVMILLLFGLGFAERLARDALLTHERWRLPVDPSAATPDHQLKVSVHLPCYAEPPEVVQATMDRLAALDYRNFEVLVCDNNTKDEALWRPLEAYCARLNAKLGCERFRFFHVAPLAGAKAGALNFCLEKMAQDTDVVAVVDADYLARPGFLARLIPFFDDPAIGYVQTPHDYRGYHESPYLDACYWEYMPNNKVDMPGVSEYGGAFTIGTMCLLRAEGLRKAGGWAEWCLTEDSEISVRLRAVGYEGVYLSETFGRGLIPETFEDYKKQRFRWTAGPVQQLRRHWRLFMPAPFAPPMPGWTKLLEILRCIAPLRMLLGMVSSAFGLGAIVLALTTGTMSPIDIPPVAALLIFIGLATGFIRTRHRYRLAGCTRIESMIAGEMARMSLSYVILTAGIAGLSRKPLAWRRTPKFAVEGITASPFDTTMPETIIASISGVIALMLLLAGGALGYGFALLACLGAMTIALRFACAPIMAMLAIRHVTHETRTEPDEMSLTRLLGRQPPQTPATVALVNRAQAGRD